MPCMTTYLSKSSFLLPLWFIRWHFSQNFNWLTVNFPICTDTGARNVLSRELNLLLPFLLDRHVVSNLPRGLLSLACMQLPVFFWNRCISMANMRRKQGRHTCALRFSRVPGQSQAKIRVPDTFHRPILENLHAVQAFYSFLAILGQHGELCTVDG